MQGARCAMSKPINADRGPDMNDFNIPFKIATTLDTPAGTLKEGDLVMWRWSDIPMRIIGFLIPEDGMTAVYCRYLDGHQQLHYIQVRLNELDLLKRISLDKRT